MSIATYRLINLLRNASATSSKSKSPHLTTKEKQNSHQILPTPTDSQRCRCRVCLQQGNIPIFGKHNKDIQISQFLMLICKIKVNANDDYPQYLCKSCFSTLIAAVKLRETASKSQSVLIKMRSVIELKNKQLIKTKLEDTKTVKVQPILQETKTSLETETNHFTDAESDLESNFEDEVPVQLEEKKNTQQEDKPNIKEYFTPILTDGEPVFECRICKQVLKKLSRATHILRHLPDHPRPFVCEVCGKSFRLLFFLNQHQLIHTNILPYQCQSCPYRGRTKSSLLNHSKIHGMEHRYHCPQCPRTFLNCSNFKRHLRRHGKPLFPCSACSRSFYENSALKHHIETQHMGIVVTHKCDICDNLYKNRKNLLKHELKAHKRKPILKNRAIYLKLEGASESNDAEEST